MRLDLLPRPNKNSKRPDNASFGMIHLLSEPCPFAEDHFPKSSRGSCCSFDANSTLAHLYALGRGDEADLLPHDVSAEIALTLAPFLRLAATRVERLYNKHHEQIEKGAVNRDRTAQTEVFLDWSRPSLEEALASIRKAADWYEKVGRLGFDVVAWD